MASLQERLLSASPWTVRAQGLDGPDDSEQRHRRTRLSGGPSLGMRVLGVLRVDRSHGTSLDSVESSRDEIIGRKRLIPY